jgi:hypothetical protein
VQPPLNQRMIEQVIVFAAGHKREASHISEHSSIAILPVKAQQGAFSTDGVAKQHRQEINDLIAPKTLPCKAYPPSLSLVRMPCFRRYSTMSTTSPNQDGVEGSDREIAWTLIREFAIQIDHSPSRSQHLGQLASRSFTRPLVCVCLNHFLSICCVFIPESVGEGRWSPVGIGEPD